VPIASIEQSACRIRMCMYSSDDWKHMQSLRQQAHIYLTRSYSHIGQRISHQSGKFRTYPIFNKSWLNPVRLQN
jgi:hypothetical protein